MPDRQDLRDVLAGLVISCIAAGIGFAALVAIAYFVMVGIGECADPWVGCQTALGVVE